MQSHPATLGWALLRVLEDLPQLVLVFNMGSSPYDRPGESPIHVEQHSGRRPYAQIILYAALATFRYQVSFFGPPLDPSSTACRVRTAYPLRCRSECAQMSLGAMQYRAPLTRFMARLRYEQTYASYGFVQRKASDSTILEWGLPGAASPAYM